MTQQVTYKQIGDCLDELDAGVWTVATLSSLMSLVIAKHGPEALIEIDAGYNNVSFRVVEVVKPHKPKKVEPYKGKVYKCPDCGCLCDGDTAHGLEPNRCLSVLGRRGWRKLGGDYDG